MSEDAPPPPPSALFTFPHRPRVLEPEDSEVLSLLLEELDVRFPSAADIVRQLIPQALLQRCVEVASTYGLQQHSPRPLPREQHSHTQLRRLLSRLLQQQQQQHKHLRQHRFVLLQRRENDGSSGNPVRKYPVRLSHAPFHTGRWFNAFPQSIPYFIGSCRAFVLYLG